MYGKRIWRDFITFNAIALRCDYRFSTFLLWLQSVQIPPHLFSAAKVTIFPNMQIYLCKLFSYAGISTFYTLFLLLIFSFVRCYSELLLQVVMVYI